MDEKLTQIINATGQRSVGAWNTVCICDFYFFIAAREKVKKTVAMETKSTRLSRKQCKD